MEPGTDTNRNLMHERDAQLAALHAAGFASVNRLLKRRHCALPGKEMLSIPNQVMTL
jgi:hypothetical protein